MAAGSPRGAGELGPGLLCLCPAFPGSLLPQLLPQTACHKVPTCCWFHGALVNIAARITTGNCSTVFAAEETLRGDLHKALLGLFSPSSKEYFNLFKDKK